MIPLYRDAVIPWRNQTLALRLQQRSYQCGAAVCGLAQLGGLHEAALRRAVGAWQRAQLAEMLATAVQARARARVRFEDSEF